MNYILTLLITTQTDATPFYNSIREMIFHSSPISKLVLLVLLIFSVFSWAVIIDKARYFRKIDFDNDNFLKIFRRKKVTFNYVYQQAANFHFSPLAQLFRAGFRQLKTETENNTPHKDKDDDRFYPGSGSLERINIILNQMSRREVNLMERSLTFLATTGAVSPFIGLFGTVWGIMNSFRGLGAHGSASIGVVAPGIAEALIATAAGLAAAIPAVIAYNHLLRQVNMAAEIMSDFSKEFMENCLLEFSLEERHNMGASPQRTGSTLSEINVTPLVDVMLVLLIIFMVTAPMLKQGFSVQLPQGTPRDIEIDESYVVSITSEEEYYFNQDLVTLEELERRLKVLNDRGFVDTVFLRADRMVPYGIVVSAMDIIKKAGVDKLGIVTEPIE